MEKDTEDYVMQLEKRIVLLEGRVSLLEAQLNAMKPMPAYPSYPAPTYPSIPLRSCAKCGMNLDGVMGYVCNDSYCPSFPKVTYVTPNFGTVWAGSNAYSEKVLAEQAKNVYNTDAKGTWPGLSTMLEPHLKTQDIKPYSPMTRGDLDL